MMIKLQDKISLKYALEIMPWHVLLFLAFLSFVFNSCDFSDTPDSQLTAISELASKDPQKALEDLQNINPDTLDNFNQKYYQLINIKAQDKADVYQASDSLILSLIDFFSTSGNDAIYAEALYYGGRTFFDMGDLPMSLKYYQEAEQAINDCDRCDNLKSCIIYQIGNVMNSLRLYESCIPYFKRSLEFDIKNRDSINIFYSLQMIGANYMHSRELDSASVYYIKARDLANELNNYKLVAQQDMYLADIQVKKNNADSALILIRKALEHSQSNLVYAYATEVYRFAEKYDSVALYAKGLIESKESNNKMEGYRLLLLPELRSYLPKDSLAPYVHKFYRLVENRLNENEGTMEIVQNSLYNYTIQEKGRIKAEKSNQRLAYWLFGVGIIVLLLIIVILAMNARTSKQKMTLMKEREVIADLNRKLRQMEEKEASRQKSAEPETDEGISSMPLDQNVKELRKLVMKEYSELQKLAKKRADVPPAILKSKAYAETRGYLDEKMSLPENSGIWEDLERVVERCSPGFKVRLRTLMGGKLKTHDLHAALLIKCGFSPTALTVLLGRTKGSISSQRGEICLRITDEHGSATMADAIISLL